MQYLCGNLDDGRIEQAGASHVQHIRLVPVHVLEKKDGVRTKNAFSLPIHEKQQKFVCNVQVCFLFLLFYHFPDSPTIARSSS